MRNLFFIGLPHQKVHLNFIQSIIGGEFVYSYSTVDEKNFSKEIFLKDGEDVIWFFTDLHFNLHPQLKGKQVLCQHGLRFGSWMNQQRKECINRYIDIVLQNGFPKENDFIKHGVFENKIRKIGYTTLFEIPNLSVKPNAVLFSSTTYRNWNHYENLYQILKNLNPEIDGHLTFHPETPFSLQNQLFKICKRKNNLTFLATQEELLKAYAFCACNVSGGISSIATSFWFLKKPVLFLRGSVGLNPWKGLGWERVKKIVNENLFNQILDECIKISHWKEFSPQLLSQATPSPSALQMFYPTQSDKELTISKIKELVQELGN